MKTLSELRTEVELGFEVYPSTKKDVVVKRLREVVSGVSCEEITLGGSCFIVERIHPDFDGTEQENPDRYPDVEIAKDFQHIEESILGFVSYDPNMCYDTFDELLADWPTLASQPVWSTAMTPERYQQWIAHLATLANMHQSYIPEYKYEQSQDDKDNDNPFN